MFFRHRWLFGPFQRRHFLDAIGVVFCMAILILILRCIGLSIAIFDPLGTALNSFKFSDGYFYAHQKMESQTLANPEVVIVDIAGCSSREEIAFVLDKVAAAEPAAVGLDVIFGPASALLKSGDDSLSTVLGRIKNLVTACNISPGYNEHSFFATGMIEGNISLPYDMVRSYTPGNGTMVGELLYAIGRKELIQERERLVDFRRVSTIIYTKDDDISVKELQNCIVLVGDTRDYRDYHRVPVNVNGQLRLSGVEIIAQELFTSLYGRYYREIPKTLTLLFGIILTWLFCALFVCRIFDNGLSFNGLRCLLAQLLAIIVFFAVGISLFFGLGWYLSPVWFLVGIGMAGLSGELYYLIIKRLKK